MLLQSLLRLSGGVLQNDASWILVTQKLFVKKEIGTGFSNPNQRVYFLPGRGEKLDGNLGQAIARLQYSIHGREITPDFARLRFAEQLALIRCDLHEAFWEADAKLIARSYGAYVLLNALAEISPFPGSILLLSQSWARLS